MRLIWMNSNFFLNFENLILWISIKNYIWFFCKCKYVLFPNSFTLFSYLTTSGIVSVAFFALVMISAILLPIQDLALTQSIIAGVLISICYLIGPLYGFGLEIMMELKTDVFCLIVTIIDNLLIFNFPTLLQVR